MILKLWTTDIWTTSPAPPPSLFSWSSCFWCWSPILFCVKNELSFCCCFMKWKQKNANKWSVNRSAKQRMWKVQMYPPVSPGIVWNDTWYKTNRKHMIVILHAHFRLVSTLMFYLNTFNNNFNHNYNKIVKSDWLSTALISALIGQFNRTVHVMPK